MRKPVNNPKSSQNASVSRVGSDGKTGDDKSAPLIMMLKRILGDAAEPKNRKFLIASILVHVFVGVAFFVHWDSDEKIKAPVIPQSIQARVVSDQELQTLRDKKKAEALKKKNALEKKRQEKKRLEKKRKREETKRLEKKRQAKKEALAKKKKAEQEALAAKKKADQDKKARALKAKQEEESKRQLAMQEKERKRLELAQKTKEENERLERESKLAERMRQLAIAKQKKAEQALRSAQQKQALERELTEVEKYTALIQSKLESRWRRTPKSKGLSAVLRLVLLPTGELANVELTRSSGNAAFDRSAMHAANSIKRYSVPEDNDIFERNFRTFSIRFAPDE